MLEYIPFIPDTGIHKVHKIKNHYHLVRIYVYTFNVQKRFRKIKNALNLKSSNISFVKYSMFTVCVLLYVYAKVGLRVGLIPMHPPTDL